MNFILLIGTKNREAYTLIAGLLQPKKGTCELFTPTNFVTWNYDLNILNAVNSFLSNYEDLNEVLTHFHVSQNQIQISYQTQIIHLNGFIQHPRLKRPIRLDKDSLEKLLDVLIDSHFSNDDKLGEYANRISFSWESLATKHLENMPLYIEEAKKAILRSSQVIVIGYSFPLYNRLIDTYLLNAGTLNGKTLYIQDPYAEELIEILKNDFGIKSIASYIGDSSTNVKSIKNCKSFFVPNNLYMSEAVGEV